MLKTASHSHGAAFAHPNEDACTAGCRTAAGAHEKEESRRGRHRRDQCYCCRQRFFLVVAAATTLAPTTVPAVAAEP